jgi:hypothetical protein
MLLFQILRCSHYMNRLYPQPTQRHRAATPVNPERPAFDPQLLFLAWPGKIIWLMPATACWLKWPGLGTFCLESRTSETEQGQQQTEARHSSKPADRMEIEVSWSSQSEPWASHGQYKPVSAGPIPVLPLLPIISLQFLSSSSFLFSSPYRWCQFSGASTFSWSSENISVESRYCVPSGSHRM